MSEDVTVDRNLNVDVKEFHYETPEINFAPHLNSKKTIKYYLRKYLTNIINYVDEYTDTNYSYNSGDDIVLTFEMLIQRFYEDFAEQPKKVLCFQDGDGQPTYFLKDVTPDFFLTPYKIHVNADVNIKGLRKEQRDIPTFKIIKTDDCVICLDNKPEIMFYDCLHCCVCSDCEKVKSSMKCPYCRKDITTKIII